MYTYYFKMTWIERELVVGAYNSSTCETEVGGLL